MVRLMMVALPSLGWRDGGARLVLHCSKLEGQ